MFVEYERTMGFGSHEDEILLRQVYYQDSRYITQSICIPMALWKKHFEGKTYVKVFFDSERRLIGLKPLDVEERNTFRIKTVKGVNIRSIDVDRLFWMWKIHLPTGYARFKVEHEDGLITFPCDPEKAIDTEIDAYTHRKGIPLPDKFFETAWTGTKVPQEWLEKHDLPQKNDSEVNQ